MDSLNARYKEHVEKGRVLARHICTRLLDPIDVQVGTFVRCVYNTVEAYARYILALDTPQVRAFVDMHVMEYYKEASATDRHAAFVNKILLDNLMPLSSQDPSNCGQVTRSIQNLNAIIQGGNLRERLTLIYNFRTSCAMLWDIIDVYTNNKSAWSAHFASVIHEPGLVRKILWMERQLGVSTSVALDTCREWIDQTETTVAHMTPSSNSKCFLNNGTLAFCTFINFPMSGQVLSSRACPQGLCRIQPDDVCLRAAETYVKDVVPPISPREKAFLGDPKDTGVLPWKGGAHFCKPKADSFYFQLYHRLGTSMITGPSGTTDLLLSLSLLYNLTLEQRQLILLGLIVWMTVPADHGVAEILVVAKEFGLVPKFELGPPDDEYTYMEDTFVPEVLEWVHNNQSKGGYKNRRRIKVHGV